MSNMVFEAAMLRPGKLGVIKPDANGYYEQCIGGLDIENAAGVEYASAKAKDLFASSSALQRRIAAKALRGERGHPRRTAEFMKESDWMHRLNDIVESNTSVHWARIELDESYGRNNPYLNRPRMIGIMARFRPYGAGAEELARSLADPESSVAFSIRAFSIPRTTMGRRFYDLQNIVTWDEVNEPGIAFAAKELSSTLESLGTESFTRGQIERAVREGERQSRQLGSIMSTQESRSNLMALAQMLHIDSGVSKPTSIYYNWQK